MTDPLGTTELLIAAAVVAAGAVVQGSVGFGLSVVSVPALLLVHPALVPGPLIAVGQMLSGVMAWRERREIHLGGLGWALLGRVPGTLLAFWLLSQLSERATALTTGCLVLLAVAISRSGLRLRFTPPILVQVGIVSGFMGTTSSMSGPPIALVYQHETGPRVRATLAIYFLLGDTLSLFALGAAGHFGHEQMVATFALLPPVALGYALALRVGRMLDGGYTRPAVLAVATLTSLVLIGKQLLA
jgi:uncharacterized membrane protein YfcA